MTDGLVPKNPDDNEFVDNASIRELRDKVIDVLRPIGLTVDPEGIQFGVHPEYGMSILIPALVRPSAKKKIEDDKASREAFNQMMANENEAMIEGKKDMIAKMIEADNFEDLFFGDAELESECSHERRHPSTGHCLDCGEGLDD
jgi:hypothetical protein